jgi:PAS domain S-box-containing protein
VAASQKPRTASPSTDLAEIVRRSPAICFVWRAAPGWPVAYVTDNVRQLGYEPDEFLSHGRTYASIVHPDDLPRVHEEVVRVEAGQLEEFVQEYRVLTASGETRWVDDRSVVRRDARGHTVAYEGIILDITARKQAELELTRTREELTRNLRFTQSLLSAVPTPVFFKDAQGRYLGCNRAFSEEMGVLPEEIVGKTVQECWPSEYAEEYHRRDLELMRNPQRQVYESKVLDRHKRVRSVIYAKNVVFDESDRVAGIVGAFTDITDLKQMETEILHRLEFERVVMQISTEFVGRHPHEIDEGIDAGLKALGVATGVTRVCLLELRSAATRMDVTHEWCHQGAEQHIDQLQDLVVDDFPMARQQIPRRQTARAAAVTGPPGGKRTEAATEVIRSMLLLPMTVATKVLGFLGVDPVRSDRPWSEDDLRLLRVAAEIFANGLDRRDAEAQLGEAQKLESVGRLAAGVAHDLNNMLTPILGFAQLLRPELDGRPEALEDLTEIIHAAERSRDLVRQLLAFSRKQILDLRPVDLPAIVLGMEKLLRSAVRENIDIQYVTPSAKHLILADTGQLEQVIMNLAMNAQDAMPHGGSLVLETSETELDQAYCADHADIEPGRYAMLVMTDNGAGMDKHTREHLFEPFFTTKEPGAGTGLGLATVYGIVKQHGGSIWLYSEPDKGTTFKIYLPIANRAALLADATLARHEVPSMSVGTTVMVAEDDPVVRRLVTSILTQAGCTVLAAATGEECLEMLERHEGRIDLLLTDVIMKDLDGRQLYDEVMRRYGDRLGPMKVLFMSGYTHNVIAHRGVLDEGVNFIQKPFAVERLAEKVREALGM